MILNLEELIAEKQKCSVIGGRCKNCEHYINIDLFTQDNKKVNCNTCRLMLLGKALDEFPNRWKIDRIKEILEK